MKSMVGIDVSVKNRDAWLLFGRLSIACQCSLQLV